MPDAPTLMAAIDACRDELDEARRYVRRNPEATEAMVVKAMGEIFGLLGPDHHDLAARLLENLAFGLVSIQSQPTVLESYLAAASGELCRHAGGIEKEARDREERDPR
jgi:hypothetical protein